MERAVVGVGCDAGEEKVGVGGGRERMEGWEE